MGDRNPQVLRTLKVRPRTQITSIMKKLDSFKAPSGGRILDAINSPSDLKWLQEKNLHQLAQEIRDELITVLSQTGGHLGPNLGVVELRIALHYVFNPPKENLSLHSVHPRYSLN